MTEKQIQRAVSRFVWNTHKQLIVPNTTSLCQYESDLVVVQPSGWSYVVEVKCTVEDFRADFKKGHRHEMLLRGRPETRYCEASKRYLPAWDTAKPLPYCQFWFAIPEDLQSRIEPELPDYAGLIVVHPHRFHGHVAKTIRKAPKLPNCRKITVEERQRLLESIYYRYWSMTSHLPEAEK